MANTNSGSVLRCDTTGLLPLAINVTGFKFVGGATGTAVVRNDSASGQIVFETAGTTNLPAEQVYIRSSQGMHVTISAGSVLYIYLK